MAVIAKKEVHTPSTSENGYDTTVYTLETEQWGEIGFEEKIFVGEDTPKLGQEDVHDSDLEAEVIVDIYVDKFFTIKKDGKVVDEIHTVCNYDEALNEFTKFFK